MRHRRTRRFRPRSNGRNHRPRSIGSDQVRMGSSPFSNGRIRNNFVSPQGAVKLIEKYQIPEGKDLGTKLKNIEEEWVNNNFKLSQNQIDKIINR